MLAIKSKNGEIVYKFKDVYTSLELVKEIRNILERRNQEEFIILENFTEMTKQTELIEQWAKDRNLSESDPSKQMLKLMEEVGELAQGIVKNKPEQIKDSLGDVFVVLVVLSMQLKLNLTECVNLAYAEIKDRKGKMVNGIFVKSEDLGRG